MERHVRTCQHRLPRAHPQQSASGIGLAVTIALAEAGAHVTIADVDGGGAARDSDDLSTSIGRVSGGARRGRL
jgi:NAD(P)-dependent dehydrogenase (short-subunit alcohol dehydrogenase family)